MLVIVVICVCLVVVICHVSCDELVFDFDGLW